MTSTITFHGGAGTVTGANFMFDTGRARFLIDCGTLERERACDPRNYDPFPYDTRSVDALFVTHAHADHIGRIPKLVHEGFRGTIYSTGATRDLAALMFDDALSVMRDEEERSHCAPIYQKEDVEHALSLWKTHEYHESFHIDDVGIEFLDAGHILGSAMVRFTRGGRTIIFTGDLGNSPEPLLHDTESPVGADYLVMESVYGDRLHEGKEDRGKRLREVVEKTRTEHGVLLIPSFSIERTQILLFELNGMVESGNMQPIPIFLDAPLAIRVTDVYRTYKNLLNADVQERFAHGDDPFAFEGLTLTPKVAESRAIFGEPNPKVIIAGAGMSHGGRIREHERQYLGDPNATILFVGYQAPGSLGRAIQDGVRDVTIDGDCISVHAQTDTIGSYSGHADRDGLMQFVSHADKSLKKVFVVMGEPKTSSFLAQRLRDFVGVDAVAPRAGETADIDF
jgi:metallo-beta-lactamase family protein